MLGVMFDVGHERFEQFPPVRRGEILPAVFERSQGFNLRFFRRRRPAEDPFVPE